MTSKREDEDEGEGEAGWTGEGREQGDGAEPVDPGAELYRGRRTWISYWKSISLGAAAVAAGVLLWERNGWILFGALLLAVGIYSYICVMRSMWLYVVTPRRIEVIYGLITKSSNEVRVKDIRAINVKKEGFQGLIGVGTVEFSSAGGDGVEVAFRDVWGAQRVKALVRGLQDADA